MSRPSRTDELPIIRAYYELILWLMPKMGKFPREHRFTLGQRMERLLCEILEKLNSRSRGSLPVVRSTESLCAKVRCAEVFPQC